MQETVTIARKWGNSIGIAIPKGIAEREKIGPNDRVAISVRRVAPLEKLFGTFKTAKTGQQLKDEAKKGWT